jgi:hypothetical protein
MTTPPMRLSDVSAQSPGTQQSATNRIEQLIIHHLVDNTIRTLTDRDGTDHEFPWSPGQQVRVGVLAPTYLGTAASGPTPPPPSSGSGSGSGSGDEDEDEDDGGAAGTPPAGTPLVVPPVENRGVVGIDFIVDTGGRDLKLTVDVRYAMYQPLWQAFAALQAEAINRTSSAAIAPVGVTPTGKARRRNPPTVPINSSWRRDERHVVVPVSIRVATGEVTFMTTELGAADPLRADAAAGVTAHFSTPEARFKLTSNQTLAAADLLGTLADFIQSRDNRKELVWTPVAPVPKITVSTVPLPDGTVAVSVSLTNDLTLQASDGLQDCALYDTRLSVSVDLPSELRPQRLGFAKDDCRYNDVATVVGRGRGCVARPGDNTASIVAETLPVHVQRAVNSAEHGIDISFSSLAAGHTATLDQIGAAMRTFLRAWDNGGATGAALAQLEALRRSFEEEVERFELGCDLLRTDGALGRSFTLANAAFAAAKPAGARWRLFQLVFIVTELGALAARENLTDPKLQAELDAVDVLWFPTGGGKTEAYLGLIAVALYYDRLRGKERGTSAWMLFPLRMLSVQQLARITQIIHHAENVRVAAGIGGDPFTLGYLVGAGNTPNTLRYPAEWWPGLSAFSGWDPVERDRRRLVGSCPKCNAANGVGLDGDVANFRLRHVCRSCGYKLPIYASDDEVARYLPSVVVSTVDKITAFARNGQLTSFNRGPAAQCPLHGWHSHKDCVVGDECTHRGAHTPPTGFKDPTPALWIQDELHLVREDLGVFAAHYHTLVAELARGAGNRPSKVIAATATIEQYEDQLSQVYGRTPRMFPTGGPTIGRSFYSEDTDDVRRMYLGILPAGGGTAKVDLAGKITSNIIANIHHLQDDPTPLVDLLAGHGIVAAPVDVVARLFDFELALAYVNSKAHGVNIIDDLDRLSEQLIAAGSDRVRYEYLTGETTLGDLAATVAAVQDDKPSSPRADRIRALVGTSVVSHGVDLDRLNFEVLAGMPPTYAHYIQATARAGRSHVGLVISVFDRMNRRETSMFQSFATTHAALERMVEPVPVNRFASRAVERTLPGVVCALLWDETRSPTWGTDQRIWSTRTFRPWWDGHAAHLIPVLRDRIANAYRCPVPQPDLLIEEQRLVDEAVRRWEQVEKPRMESWQGDRLDDLFTSQPMTILRDVNPPAEFGAGTFSSQAVDRILR